MGALNGMAKSFSGIDNAEMDKATAGMTAAVGFLGHYAEAVTAVGMTSPGLITTAWDSFESMFGVDQFQRLADNIDKNKDAIVKIVQTFAPMAGLAPVTMQANLNTTALTTQQIQQVVTVQVSGTVTADDCTTHDLLSAILKQLKSQGGDVPQGSSTTRDRPISPESAAFAGGGG